MNVTLQIKAVNTMVLTPSGASPVDVTQGTKVDENGLNCTGESST